MSTRTQQKLLKGFSILSIFFTCLTTSLLALAAPAIPTGLVPNVAPPVGVKLYNATAGYNATHGLPYDKNVHGPLTQRDLQVRQAYTGDATFFYPGLGACEGTNTQWEDVVALNAPQWNNKGYCWRTVIIQAYGKKIPAAIVDLTLEDSGLPGGSALLDESIIAESVFSSPRPQFAQLLGIESLKCSTK
ncbi:hypothetical protein RSAG8_10605, partial [Rhizoctonia solani AG-8 WAC10335]